MSKEEFLRDLRSVLAGEVPDAVIRDNVSYYDSYLSQEMAKGRTVDEITAEIGDPRIVAKTIIDSCEAAQDTAGDGGNDSGYRSYGEQQSPHPGLHYIDLSKWYWKLLLIVVAVTVGTLLLSIVGGIVSLALKLAGPLLMVFLLVWFVRSLKH